MAFCDLSEIIFQSLDEEYGLGKYGDAFTILIRRSDSFVNASKLYAEGGRRFDYWYANQGSKELIAYFERLRKTTALDTVLNVRNELRGTYVHQDLVPIIAGWISVEFALKVAQVMNAFLVRQHRETVRAKDDRIDQLMKEVRYQTRLNESQTQMLEENARKMVRLEENLIEALKSHRQVSERVVPYDRIDAQQQEQMVILHHGSREYQCARGQARYIASQIRRLKARVVVQLENQPNPVELWLCIKGDLEAAEIKVYGTTFEMDPAREPWLINVINACVQEKFTQVNRTSDQVIRTLEWNFDTLMRTKSIAELRDMCKRRNLSGYSRLNKTDLVNFLLQH